MYALDRVPQSFCLPPAHRKLSARGCFKLRHSQALVICMMVSLTIQFQHLVGIRRKILGRSLFTSSQSHIHLYFLYSYQVLYFVLLQLPVSSQGQLCGHYLKQTLDQRPPSVQSIFTIGFLCLLSFIGLPFLRISSVLTLTIQRFRNNMIF